MAASYTLRTSWAAAPELVEVRSVRSLAANGGAPAKPGEGASNPAEVDPTGIALGLKGCRPPLIALVFLFP